MTDRPDKKTTARWIRFKGVEWVFMNLPYVCFLAFLGLVYIYNAHSVERKMRKIDTLKSEVSDLRWRHLNVKQEIMYGSTQSQIQRRVADLKLKSVEEPPITVKKEQ